MRPEDAWQDELVKKAAARQAGLPFDAIQCCRVVRKSIDARQRELKSQLSVQLFMADEPILPPYEAPLYRDVSRASKRVVIVGCGPAGLFAALRLLELGVKPILLERGRPVADRKRDIALLNQQGLFNPDSNYCFGEGGAGTFSDGKLYTRSNKRGNVHRIFELFHYHGAQDAILSDVHPHIGSDRLPRVIQHMRDTIRDCGGEVHFETLVTGLLLDGDRCVGVRTHGGESIQADAVILAPGHSAHDTYEMLQRQGIQLEAKGFAMGVRVEHPQLLIDQIQYHLRGPRPEWLPTASYAQVAQCDGRGVYSFCMCPGGMMVPASSSPDLQVVNGMSGSHRSSPFANSGIVVEMHPEDLSSFFQQQGSLAGLHYQLYVERLARQQTIDADGHASMAAPAQRLADFVSGRHSQSLPACSYPPGVVSSDLDKWLPEAVTRRLQQGFRQFDRRMHGYLTQEALILGVESRSSSPVRIPRDSMTLQHVAVRGLYPAGEGAGYAGGITSSAMDGVRCADATTQCMI